MDCRTNGINDRERGFFLGGIGYLCGEGLEIFPNVLHLDRCWRGFFLGAKGR